MSALHYYQLGVRTTTNVRSLDMLAPLDPVRDIRLSGQVIYTGHSSMEIAVKMEALNSGGVDETIMLGTLDCFCRFA